MAETYLGQNIPYIPHAHMRRSAQFAPRTSKAVAPQFDHLLAEASPTATASQPFIPPTQIVSPLKTRAAISDIARPTVVKPTFEEPRSSLVLEKSKPALPRQTRTQVIHRSTFGPKVAKKTQARLRRHRHVNYTPKILAGMVVILFLLGTGAVVNSFYTNHLERVQAAVLGKKSAEGSNEIPDETGLPPNANETYQVSPDLPRLLQIPKIQVEARIKRLPSEESSDLKAPYNIYDAGWYDGSSKPGEDGAVLIDGHISGPTTRGIFYSLGSLRPDDKVAIARGDGRVFTYKVVRSKIYDYDKVDMGEALRSAVPGKQGLNLITSGGRYDVRANRFEQRLIVFCVRE